MKRPQPYAPLGVYFATRVTGTRIQEEFGVEGLGVWACMIAAAQRGEGQIVFAHEHDWRAIGILTPPSFGLLEFLHLTGKRLRQTRMSRHGQTIYIDFSRWSVWNESRRREVARQQKARKRHESKPDTNRTPPGQKTAIELEIEEEQRAVSPTRDPALDNGASDSPEVDLSDFQTPTLRSIP